MNIPNIDRYGVASCTTALQDSFERDPNGCWNTWGPFWRQISGCRRFRYSIIPCHDRGHKSCGLGVQKTFKIYPKSTPKWSQGAPVLPQTGPNNGSKRLQNRPQNGPLERAPKRGGVTPKKNCPNVTNSKVFLIGAPPGPGVTGTRFWTPFWARELYLFICVYTHRCI